MKKKGFKVNLSQNIFFFFGLTTDLRLCFSNKSDINPIKVIKLFDVNIFIYLYLESS